MSDKDHRVGLSESWLRIGAVVRIGQRWAARAPGLRRVGLGLGSSRRSLSAKEELWVRGMARGGYCR